eukprot:Gregarina_sp_Poly_1__5111@NODE_2704_length_1808_cov_34_428489_g1715_i0_p2_GENE_NODE_2704_length_1808_cov_34_428489_g1715_i0NODE_2704_length_1808_cov_34_428489_g1715_i0_p2_ORF_typecomplete_len100_score9_45_NODE_2704_length_1808_cov_34_428489_g1715_i0351650
MASHLGYRYLSLPICFESLNCICQICKVTTQCTCYYLAIMTVGVKNMTGDRWVFSADLKEHKNAVGESCRKKSTPTVDPFPEQTELVDKGISQFLVSKR